MKTILNIILTLLGLGKQASENKGVRQEHQTGAIEEKGETIEVKQDHKQDKLKDREVRTEPKQLIEFSGTKEMDFLKQCQEKWVLYCGDKQEILKRIQRDDGSVLTREQEKWLKRDVRNSNNKWFIIRIHPLTIHENK